MGTAGVFVPDCECQNVWMLGATLTGKNPRRDWGSRVSTVLGYRGSLGFGSDKDTRYASAAFSLPAQLEIDVRGGTLTFFAEPAFAVGDVFGFRPALFGPAVIIGGGVSASTHDGKYALSAAASRIRLEGATTTYGVSVQRRLGR